jgi:hypothetical protein
MSTLTFEADELVRRELANQAVVSGTPSDSIQLLPSVEGAPGESLIDSILPAMVGIATIFIVLLVFLSFDKVSASYGAATWGDRAKFAIFLSLLAVSVYNLSNFLYRLIRKKGSPNTNFIWITAVLFIFAILSVSFWSFLST